MKGSSAGVAGQGIGRFLSEIHSALHSWSLKGGRTLLKFHRVRRARVCTHAHAALRDRSRRSHSWTPFALVFRFPRVRRPRPGNAPVRRRSGTRPRRPGRNEPGRFPARRQRSDGRPPPGVKPDNERSAVRARTFSWFNRAGGAGSMRLLRDIVNGVDAHPVFASTPRNRIPDWTHSSRQVILSAT